MRALSRQGSCDLRIRTIALREIEKVPPKDFRGEIDVLFDYVCRNVRYVHDIYGVETLHYPLTVLDIGQGDCDDMAILLAALLLSVGHRVRFVVLAMEPERWSHVWTAAQPSGTSGGAWIDLDPTEALPSGEHVPLPEGAQLLTLDV